MNDYKIAKLEYLKNLWQVNRFAQSWHIYSNDPEYALKNISDFWSQIFAEDIQIPLSSNPDFMIIKSGAENNGESKSVSKLITTEQLKTTKNFLSKSPSIAKYKVVIIFKAETMNNNAMNGCLKILEEPQANCYIFLITGKLAKLPSTITSRCNKLLLDTLLKPEPMVISQELIDLVKANAVGTKIYDKIGEMIDKLTKKNDYMLWQEFSHSCLQLVNNFVRIKVDIEPTSQLPQEINKLIQKFSMSYLLEIYNYINDILSKTYKQDLDQRQAVILLLNKICMIQ